MTDDGANPKLNHGRLHSPPTRALRPQPQPARARRRPSHWTTPRRWLSRHRRSLHQRQGPLRRAARTPSKVTRCECRPNAVLPDAADTRSPLTLARCCERRVVIEGQHAVIRCLRCQWRLGLAPAPGCSPPRCVFLLLALVRPRGAHSLWPSRLGGLGGAALRRLGNVAVGGGGGIVGSDLSTRACLAESKEPDVRFFWAPTLVMRHKHNWTRAVTEIGFGQSTSNEKPKDNATELHVGVHAGEDGVERAPPCDSMAGRMDCGSRPTRLGMCDDTT